MDSLWSDTTLAMVLKEKVGRGGGGLIGVDLYVSNLSTEEDLFSLSDNNDCDRKF